MNKEELNQLIKQRETDITHYQVNIDNYEAILFLLPKQWPKNLEPYHTEEPVSFIKDWSFEQIQLLSDLQFKDKLERTLLTERLEQRKSKLVLEALQQKFQTI